MADKPAPVEKHETPKELESRASVQKYMGRAKRSPEQQAEFFYNVKTTHIIFLVSSVLMLVSYILWFEKDHNREWKPYQIEFWKMNFEKLVGDLRSLEEAISPHEERISRVDESMGEFLRQFRSGQKGEELDVAAFPSLRGRLTDLEALLKQKLEGDEPTGWWTEFIDGGKWRAVHVEVDAAKLKLRLREQEEIRGKHYKASQDFNFAKDSLAEARFFYEKYKHHLDEMNEKGELDAARKKKMEDEFTSKKEIWMAANDKVARTKLKVDQLDRLKEFYEEFVAALETRAVRKGGEAVWSVKEKLSKADLETLKPLAAAEKPPGVYTRLASAYTLDAEQSALLEGIRKEGWLNDVQRDALAALAAGAPTAADIAELLALAELRLLETAERTFLREVGAPAITPAERDLLEKQGADPKTPKAQRDFIVALLNLPLEGWKKEKLRLVKERDDALRRLESERPSMPREIRNQPMSDFFGADYKVKQQPLPNIEEKVDFLISTKVGRVDRCHTCHVGIDNPGYEVYRRPWEESELDRYVFKDPMLRKYIEHALGQRRQKDGSRATFPPEECPVCAGKEREEWNRKHEGEKDRQVPEEPLIAHESWGTDEAIKFTKAFMAHPRLDLFVSDASKHPIQRFGCTICHEGDGRDTVFTRVVHTPDTFPEGQDWRRRHGTPYGEEHYNWGYRELWDYPMIRTKYLQSSCRRCHEQEVELDGAEKYIEGMKIFERVGCYACHKTNTYPVLDKHLDGAANLGKDKVRRPGPPLTRIATKVTREWTMKWIQAPRGFRANARMPHFFGQSNSRNEVDGRTFFKTPKAGEPVGPSPIEDAIVYAMVEYLYDLSDKDADPAPPENLKGDAERGRLITRQVGCVACHQTEETPLEEYEKRGTSRYLEEWGPNLAGVGSKMNRAWLFNWVKDPKLHFKRSAMPDLRLTEQEAVDVVEYLMTLKKPEWEKLPAPASPEEALLKALLVEQLKKQMPDRYAEREYEAMGSRDERVRRLGRRMIRHYGCYSCHELKKDGDDNWGGDEGIGVEFTGSQPWGNKHHDRLDFGFASDDRVNHHGVSFNHQFTGKPVELDLYGDGKSGPGVHVPHTREHFLEAKLTDPRLFDGGKMSSKPWDELLRMPNFGFTDWERERLATFILSFTEHKVLGYVDDVQKRLDPGEVGLQRGMRVARDNNCVACHRLQLDTFEVKWDRTIDGKNVTTYEPVEGRKRLEMTMEQAEGNLKRWGILDDSTPDDQKKRMKLWSVAWAGDHRKLVMSKAITPANQFVAYDGDDWWYLDLDKDGNPWKRPIRRHLPADGGAVLPKIDAVKAEINDAHRKIFRALEDKYAALEDAIDKEKDAAKKAKLEEELDEVDNKLNTIPEVLIPRDQMEARYPPMLRTQGVKTQSDWLFEFLKSPYQIRPNMAPIVKGGVSVIDLGIRMPTFGLTDEEATALVRWFAERDHLEGVDVYPHTAFPQREEEFLKRRADVHKAVAPVLSDRTTGCLTCHYVGGEAPRGGPEVAYKFGPELGNVYKRFRPRWLYEWIDNPAMIYPGTVMTQYDFSAVLPRDHPNARRDGAEGATEVLLNWVKFYSGN